MTATLARSSRLFTLGPPLRQSCRTQGRGYYRSASYSIIAQHDRPFRMAVIGSGPAGFYTAYKVMSLINGAKVDMYEALPVPFGLVRFGVAPDHPEVKKCQERFEEVADSPDFTFLGNVSVGSPAIHENGVSVALESVLRNYDAVLFAYGAAKDRKLGIPGEDILSGIYSARDFVGWYNGLPEFANLAPDLTKGEDVVVIGQGNVALDCARILLEDVDRLRKTDIAEHAFETLAKSRIKRVSVVGRRGPMQAAFTIKEVRELMKLDNVSYGSFDRLLIPENPKDLPRAPKRLMEVLLKGSTAASSTSAKSWSTGFCLSPVRFEGIDTNPQEVTSTVFEKTHLTSPFDPNSAVSGTGQEQTLKSSLVLRSIGYKSVALPDFEQLQIPFDDRRGVILNDGLGRVIREVRTPDGAMTTEASPGLYCAGWVKRGPTGVIASTMEDAFTTAAAIAHDFQAKTPTSASSHGAETEPGGWEGVLADSSSIEASKVVRWSEWQKIDTAERQRGKSRGKEREKFANTDEMLAVLR